MKFQKLAFLVIANIFITTVSAQNKNEQAFLVTESQDTTYGIIRKTSEVMHIDQGLYYKPTEDAEETLYPFHNIKAYRDKEGRIYFKKQIPRSNDSVTRFLELLFIGELNLYEFELDFYIEKENKIYKLKDTYTDKVNEDGKMVRKHHNEYVSILNVLLSDCFQVYDEIIITDLKAKDLMKLLENYHLCVNEHYSFIAENRKLLSTLKIGLFFGGYSASSTAYISTDRNMEVSNLKEQNYIFGADFYLNHINHKNFHFIFSPHLSFENSYYHGTTRVYNDYWLYNYDLNYRFNQLDLPLGVGFTLNRRKIQPFINTGFVISQLWKGSYTYTEKRRPAGGSLDEQTTIRGSEAEIPSNRMFGIWASFGFNYHINKNITLFNRFRYQTNNFSLDSRRVKGVDKLFNYHQFKFEVGVLF